MSYSGGTGLQDIVIQKLKLFVSRVALANPVKWETVLSFKE
jgi:hypothetical protein